MHPSTTIPAHPLRQPVDFPREVPIPHCPLHHRRPHRPHQAKQTLTSPSHHRHHSLLRPMRLTSLVLGVGSLASSWVTLLQTLRMPTSSQSFVIQPRVSDQIEGLHVISNHSRHAKWQRLWLIRTQVSVAVMVLYALLTRQIREELLSRCRGCIVYLVQVSTIPAKLRSGGLFSALSHSHDDIFRSATVSCHCESKRSTPTNRG